MADQQQKAAALQPTTTTKDIPRPHSQETEEERLLQEALEDDEVREALRLLHARGAQQSDGLA